MIFDSESILIILLLIGILIVVVSYSKSQAMIKNKENFNDNSNKFNDNNEINFIADRPEHRSPRRNDYYNRRRRSNIDYDIESDDDFDMGAIIDVLNNNSKTNSKNNKRSPSKHNKVISAKTEFIEVQYHADYNDVITAINDLTPQKELFNLGFLPVVETEPNRGNVKSLVKLFLRKINNDITQNVQEYLHTNSGWNDMGKRRREKSGFEEQMEELGLPGSLYAEPAGKARVRLVKVDKAIQSTTEDQIRFTIYIIIQKENVSDQMVLRIHFFMEREDLGNNDRDDRANFFTKGLKDENDNEINENQIVIIEQIFVIGFLTDSGKPKTRMDKFHEYEGINYENGMIDQEKVIKMMLIKHKERENELNAFLNTTDNETKEIHDIPGIDSYSQYKNTRTIMDDLAKFPHKSFGDITM